MKVVEPTPLMRAAAAALAPVIDDVVVIGAVAIGVALSPDLSSGKAGRAGAAGAEPL